MLDLDQLQKVLQSFEKWDQCQVCGSHRHHKLYLHKLQCLVGFDATTVETEVDHVSTMYLILHQMYDILTKTWLFLLNGLLHSQKESPSVEDEDKCEKSTIRSFPVWGRSTKHSSDFFGSSSGNGSACSVKGKTLFSSLSWSFSNSRICSKTKPASLCT